MLLMKLRNHGLGSLFFTLLPLSNFFENHILKDMRYTQAGEESSWIGRRLNQLRQSLCQEQKGLDKIGYTILLLLSLPLLLYLYFYHPKHRKVSAINIHIGISTENTILIQFTPVCKLYSIILQLVTKYCLFLQMKEERHKQYFQ